MFPIEMDITIKSRSTREPDHHELDGTPMEKVAWACGYIGAMVGDQVNDVRRVTIHMHPAEDNEQEPVQCQDTQRSSATTA